MAKRKATGAGAGREQSPLARVYAEADRQARPLLEQFAADARARLGTDTAADLQEGEALAPNPEALRGWEKVKRDVTLRLAAEAGVAHKLFIVEITQEEEAAMPKTVKGRKAQSQSGKSSKQAAEKVTFEAPVLAEHDKDWGPKGRRTTLKCEFRKGSVLMGIAELFTREPGLTKKEIVAAAQKKFADHDPRSIEMHVVWAITHLRQRYPGFNIGRDDEGRYSTLIVGRSTKRAASDKPKAAKPAKAKKAAPKKAKAPAKKTADRKAPKAPRKPKAAKAAPEAEAAPAPDPTPATEAPAA